MSLDAINLLLGLRNPLSSPLLASNISSTIEETTAAVYKASKEIVNSSSIPQSLGLHISESLPACGDASILPRVQSVLERSILAENTAAPIFNSTQPPAFIMVPDLAVVVTRQPRCYDTIKYEDLKNALEDCYNGEKLDEADFGRGKKYPFSSCSFYHYASALKKHYSLEKQVGEKEALNKILMGKSKRYNSKYLTDLIKHFEDEKDLISTFKCRMSTKRKRGASETEAPSENHKFHKVARYADIKNILESNYEGKGTIAALTRHYSFSRQIVYGYQRALKRYYALEKQVDKQQALDKILEKGRICEEYITDLIKHFESKKDFFTKPKEKRKRKAINEDESALKKNQAPLVPSLSMPLPGFNPNFFNFAALPQFDPFLPTPTNSSLSKGSEYEYMKSALLEFCKTKKSPEKICELSPLSPDMLKEYLLALRMHFDLVDKKALPSVNPTYLSDFIEIFKNDRDLFTKLKNRPIF